MSWNINIISGIVHSLSAYCRKPEKKPQTIALSIQMPSETPTLKGRVIEDRPWTLGLKEKASMDEILAAIPSHYSDQEKIRSFLQEVERRKGKEEIAQHCMEVRYRFSTDNQKRELLKQIIEKDPSYTTSIRDLILFCSRDLSQDELRPMVKKFAMEIPKDFITLDAIVRARYFPRPLEYILNNDRAGIEEDRMAWGSEQNQEYLLNVLKGSFQGIGFDWIEPLLDSVKENAPLHRKTVVSLACILIWISLITDTEQIKELNETHFLQDLFHTGATALYLPVAVRGMALFSSLEKGDWRKEVFSQPLFKSAKIMLLHFAETKDEFDHLSASFFTGKNREVFKKGPNLTFLVLTLYSIWKESYLNESQKRKLVSLLAHSRNPLDRIRDLATVIDLKQGKDLETMLEEERFEERLKPFSIEAVRKRVQLEGTDLNQRINETFGASMDPTAIWRFTTKIYKDVGPLGVKCLTDFINGVLNGTFPDIRYDPKHNSHLQKLNPSLVEKWREAVTLPVQSAFFEKPLVFLQRLFKAAPLREMQMPRLLRYLNEGTRAEMPHGPPPKDLSEEAKQLHILEDNLLKFARAKKEDALSRLVPVLNSRGPAEWGPYKEQIEKWGSNFKKRSQDEGFTIIDSDRWDHLLLHSTVVPDSCLNIDNIKSKFLLGRLMNGQARVLVVVDGKGNMIGRAMLQLLLDENGKEVLFLDRYYGPVFYQQAMLRLALEKARKMGLLLTGQCDWIERKSCKAYPVPLISHRGRSPLDYSDGEFGNSSSYGDGTLTIKTSYFVTDTSFPWKGGHD